MEKGIEDEEDNLYEQVENVATKVQEDLKSISPNVRFNAKNSEGWNNNSNLNYNKLFDILYQAFLKALNSCRMELDDDGFIKLIRNEIYEVL